MLEYNRNELTRKLGEVILPNEYFDPASLQVHLINLVEQIANQLQAESLNRQQAQNLGESIAELTEFQAEGLGKVLETLTTFFFEALLSEQTTRWQPRVFALLSEIATGFVRYSVTRTEDYQDIHSKFFRSMIAQLRATLKSLIIAQVSLKHDLKNEDNKAALINAQQISESSEQMQALLNECRDIFKTDEKKGLELHPQTFLVEEVILDLEQVFKPIATKNGNELHIKYGTNLGTLYADVIRVRQILINLLSNACKFTERGTISLSANREKQAENEVIAIRVRDTGIGIPVEQQSNLFIWRLRSDKLKQGLGLSIAYNLCYRMGGHMTLESEIGKGSTFSVYFPFHGAG